MFYFSSGIMCKTVIIQKTGYNESSFFRTYLFDFNNSKTRALFMGSSPSPIYRLKEKHLYELVDTYNDIFYELLDNDTK